MHKILLVEDRIERQDLFSKETGFNFDRYSNILDNTVSLDDLELNHYSTIICHRSAFWDSDSNVLDTLKDHCKKTQSQLVFFSGGISSTFYTHSDYEFLLLNSKSFYSYNLQIYLDDVIEKNSSNLRLLAYGKNWKINLLLNTLTKVNLFISENIDKEKIKAQRLKTYSQIENIKEFIEIEYPEVGSGGAILLKDVQIFASKLTDKVKHEIIMNG